MVPKPEGIIVQTSCATFFVNQCFFLIFSLLKTSIDPGLTIQPYIILSPRDLCKNLTLKTQKGKRKFQVDSQLCIFALSSAVTSVKCFSCSAFNCLKCLNTTFGESVANLGPSQELLASPQLIISVPCRLCLPGKTYREHGT